MDRQLLRGNWQARLAAGFKRDWMLYAMLLIPAAYLFLFKYVPLAGLRMAFLGKPVKISLPYSGGFVGFEIFRSVFRDKDFYLVLRNTLMLNFLDLLVGFPFPIVLALLLNEVRVSFVKRGVQTLLYLPHFLSWVVIAGIFYDILGANGLLNMALKALGLRSVQFLANERYFRSLMVVTTMWKESGWSTIVYLSAITAIDPQLYEAAGVDGAGRWRQTFSITLPSIVNTIAFIIILRASSIVGSDTEQVMMFYKPIVYSVGDVLGTFIYREGILNAKYSYTTAVGLFGSAVGMAMMLGANKVARKYTDKGIW